MLKNLMICLIGHALGMNLVLNELKKRNRMSLKRFIISFSRVCAEFENNFRHTRVGNYTIVDAVLHRIALKIGLEFISVAFVMLMNGVDIEQVSSLTVTNMCNTLIQTQTEKALATLIPYVTTKPVWRMCENCIRADIVAHLIKATNSIILPALKASALECGKQAIVLQKKEDKRIAHFFNDSKHALNGGLSPKLIRLIKQQKNTK
jgi:hypothetical protein